MRAGTDSVFRRALASDYFVFGLCVVYAAIVAPFTPGFATPDNFGNILATLLPLLVIALGQMLVMIAGGIDLSVTSIVGLASIVGALAINDDTGWLAGSALATPVGVLLMLALGAAVGAFNGLAITQLRMPAFIVTLAGMMAFSGLAVWLTQSKAINRLPAAFNLLGGTTAITFAIVVFVAAFLHLLLSRSLFGRWLYAVGHNPRTAHISGVPVAGTIVAAYVASGILLSLIHI